VKNDKERLPAESDVAPVLRDLSAALGRLVAGNPIVVHAPYTINQKTVCEEAARHRSTIKNTDKFAGIRTAIAIASAQHRKADRRHFYNRERQRNLKTIKRLREENAALQHVLDEAGETILRLYLRVESLEQEQRRYQRMIANARQTSSVVDKVLRAVGLDTESIRVEPR